MGRIVGPVRRQGWVKVVPLTAEPDDAARRIAQWWLRQRGDGGAWRQHDARVEASRTAATLIAQFAGIDDREAAAAYCAAAKSACRASALPAAAENEIYWSDLVGLAVVNRQGVRSGRVAAVQDFGAHPVLRVERDEGRGRTADSVRRRRMSTASIVAGGRIDVDWQLDY